MTNKKDIRQRMHSYRSTITPSHQKEASHHVCDRLATHPIFLRSQVIASYIAHNGEINPASLVSDFPDKMFVFPRVNNKEGNLSFAAFTNNDAGIVNRYGILEPNATHTFTLLQIDLILLPLVAFDDRAHRLGHGAGYYDRTLAAHSHPVLFGLAYDWQRVAHIPKDPWDVPLDEIIIA